MTTDRSTQAALLALLDTMIADPYMFAPQVVASAAERARDMIVALDSSLTASDKLLREARGMMPEACACGDRGCNVMRDLEAEIDAHLEKANG